MLKTIDVHLLIQMLVSVQILRLKTSTGKIHVNSKTPKYVVFYLDDKFVQSHNVYLLFI